MSRRNHEVGRFSGINRFGEQDPHPARKHPYENAGHYTVWSRDPRSEAFKEKNYKGKGPKGYVRSDERIREEACECLTDHPEINPRKMEVHVSQGIVTLEGVVEDRQTKRAIEDLIDDVCGVKDIHNHLTLEKHVEGWVSRLDEVSENTNSKDEGLRFTKGLY